MHAPYLLQNLIPHLPPCVCANGHARTSEHELLDSQLQNVEVLLSFFFFAFSFSFFFFMTQIFGRLQEALPRSMVQWHADYMLGRLITGEYLLVIYEAWCSEMWYAMLGKPPHHTTHCICGQREKGRKKRRNKGMRRREKKKRKQKNELPSMPPKIRGSRVNPATRVCWIDLKPSSLSFQQQWQLEVVVAA